MYQFFLQLQYIGIILCVLILSYVYGQRASRAQKLLLLLIHSVLINNIGYTLEMLSTDKEKAIMAVKVIYCGKPYIILSLFFIVMLYCGVRLPKWAYALLGTFHLGISVLVFTCENNTLYYSSIGYTQDGLFPHLVLGHGIVYKLYMAVMLFFLISMLAISSWKLAHTSSKTAKKRLCCLVMMVCISFAGFFLFLSGVTQGYDATVLAYSIAALILVYALVKYDLMDALAAAKEMIIDEFVDGVLVLNEKEKTIYTNKQFKEIYASVGEGGEKAIQRIIELQLSSRKLMAGDKIYEVHGRDIVRDETFLGRVYLVSDVTESYHYMVELEKQKELADQANRAKSDFLARMSHEIRTPINSILGMNEIILRESTEPEIRKYSMDAKSSANSLLSIINDILDFSKIESGKMEILPVEYGLGSLLNDLVNIIYIKVKEKNLKFEVFVKESLPSRLYGDDVRIRQVLINLLTNAVKYTPEGTVTLSVSGEAAGGQVRMHYEVRDTGIGIKEEDLPELFVSFQRIEENRNRNIEGTGLGMGIVQHLLAMMDSSLKVESVYGKGSVFSFDLVQAVRSKECIGNFEKKVQQLWEEYSYHTSFTAPRASALVVDDNDINRSVFRNLLKKTLIQVTDADSGEGCLELVAREHFDIIFMDHMMPKMDGIETYHRMKNQEENLCRDVPVIILTANAVTGAKEYYMEAGFYDFLSKPIIPDKLERMLQKYLPEELIQKETVQKNEPENQAEIPKETVQKIEPENQAETWKEISESETKPESAALPDLEEFDWAYAGTHFPDEQLLRETLKRIYRAMDSDMQKLEALITDIEEPENLAAYRMQLHTLKSTMASVGALLLSKLARLMEAAAAGQEMDKLRVLHPILLEEMQKHKQRLEIFVKQEMDKQAEQEEQTEQSSTQAAQLDEAQAGELLQQLKSALEDWDYDTADAIMEQLEAFAYSDSRQELLQDLKNQVQNLQAKEAVLTIQKLMQP